ncbi:hypothetical protein CTAM01_14630 [Colletotrichum tamarilloi]|uniref:DUF8212 domain-containing protein n=1 Tax=Colletotrichum tamarilloi TaxID=1209934 RepID=A0ABQ9QNR6_9PEZI|nr:uncharacterized protein CTAM01_14630 [Colletotrichum tamarilloi]KAK1479696.1 hypothetical protein CTAM01_14630 [Colletotrichum tamarilloi]
MSWMANRVTSREEDITYSMLGIFNVFMTPQYGEGPRAFQRLQETILSSQAMDESLFAWRMPDVSHGETVHGTNEGWAPDEWGLLAPSPKWFKDCGSMTCTDELPSRIFTWTTQGIEGNFIRIMDNRKTVSMGALTGFCLGSIVCLPCGILMVVHGIRYLKKKFYGDYAFVLNCFDTNAKGETTRVNIFLRVLQKPTEQKMTAFAPQIPGYRRVRCTELGTKEKATPCNSRHKAVVYQPVPQISD